MPSKTLFIVYTLYIFFNYDWCSDFYCFSKTHLYFFLTSINIQIFDYLHLSAIVVVIIHNI